MGPALDWVCYLGSGFFLITDNVNPRLGWLTGITGGVFVLASVLIHNA